MFVWVCGWVGVVGAEPVCVFVCLCVRLFCVHAPFITDRSCVLNRDGGRCIAFYKRYLSSVDKDGPLALQTGTGPAVCGRSASAAWDLSALLIIIGYNYNRR